MAEDKNKRIDNLKILRFESNKCVKVIGSNLNRNDIFKSLTDEEKKTIEGVTIVADSLNERKIAYINIVFNTHEAAKEFIKKYNQKEVGGSKLTMFFKMSKEQRNEIECNTFIRGIGKDVSFSKFMDVCEKYGRPISIKLGQTQSGERLEYGFAQFLLKGDAFNFMEHVDEIKKELGIDGKIFEIVPYKQKVRNWIYFSNFSSKDKIKELFESVGNLSEPEKNFKIFNLADRVKQKEGEEKKDMFYGYVKFETAKEAIQAIKKFNKKDVLENGNNVIVDFVRTKKEIKKERSIQKYTMKRNLETIYKDSNVIINGVSLRSVDDLKKELSQFGEIYATNYKWINHQQVNTAFVCYTEKENADKFIDGVNKHLIKLFGFEVKAEKYNFRTTSKGIQTLKPFVDNTQPQRPLDPIKQKQHPPRTAKKENKKNVKQAKPRPKPDTSKKQKPEQKPKEEFNREVVGEKIFDTCEVVMKLDEDLASQITGVLLESLPPEELMILIKNKTELRKTILEAKDAIEKAKATGGL